MLSKFLKILFSLLLLISVQNCGYQPLLTEKYQKFNINTFNISGDKKLGQMLTNRFVEVKDAENELVKAMAIWALYCLDRKEFYYLKDKTLKYETSSYIRKEWMQGESFSDSM